MSSAVDEADVIDGLASVVTLVRFGGSCDVQTESSLAGLSNESEKITIIVLSFNGCYKKLGR